MLKGEGSTAVGRTNGHAEAAAVFEAPVFEAPVYDSAVFEIDAAAEARRAVAACATARPAVDGRRAPPRHVAIIMDGNGRWAQARRMPRIAGHRRGADTVREVVRACPGLGVEVLTLYAFSTENWRRPIEEVSGLMDLFRFFLRREAAALAREGVRVQFIGDPAPLSADIRDLMDSIVRLTAANTRLTLVIALNYGGRAEIAAAARRLAVRAAAGEIAPEEITEAALAAEMSTASLPDPDLVIRTSGEQRISNFLLWQSAYSEFLFAPEAWPEFGTEVFARAVESYRRRDRRFGAVTG